MKSSEGGSAGPPGEQADREVERAPPGVHGRRAAAEGRAEVPPARAPPGSPRRSRRRPGRGRSWRARRPRRAGRSRHLLRRRVDRHGPPSAPTAASSSRVTSPTGRSGASGIALHAARRCARPPPRGVRRSSAATNAPEPSGAGSGSVSQPRALSRRAACWSCGSGGASADGELAEHLRVRVQRVAGGAPLLVGQCGPARWHGPGR